MEQIINNNPLILNDVNHPLAKEAILRIIEKRKEDGFEGISIDKLIIVSILFQINAENKMTYKSTYKYFIFYILYIYIFIYLYIIKLC